MTAHNVHGIVAEKDLKGKRILGGIGKVPPPHIDDGEIRALVLPSHKKAIKIHRPDRACSWGGTPPQPAKASAVSEIHELLRRAAARRQPVEAI